MTTYHSIGRVPITRTRQNIRCRLFEHPDNLHFNFVSGLLLTLEIEVMITAVDTNILLDILILYAQNGDISEVSLTESLEVGSIIISATVFAEIVAHFPARKKWTDFFKKPEYILDLRALMRFIWPVKNGASTCTGGRIPRFVLQVKLRKTGGALDMEQLLFHDNML